MSSEDQEGTRSGQAREAGPEERSEREPVSYTRHRRSALVTINRPFCRNAIDGHTATELERAVRRFESDPSAQVLIITGAGTEAFCAGADLKRIDSFASRVNAPAGPLGFTRLTTAKPTIAAISGWCVAGGLEIALWCDLRIAASGSKLGFTERRFGVPLIDGGTQRLPRIVGLGRALELILTGRVIDAQEALAIGLVNEIVSEGAHLERAFELAEQIASFPQQTMLADRTAAISGLDMPLPAGLELESRSGPALLDQARAGAARFAAGAGRSGRPLHE